MEPELKKYCDNQTYLLLCEEKSYDNTIFKYIAPAQYLYLNGVGYWYDMELRTIVPDEDILKVMSIPEPDSALWSFATDYRMTEK